MSQPTMYAVFCGLAGGVVWANQVKGKDGKPDTHEARCTKCGNLHPIVRGKL